MKTTFSTRKAKVEQPAIVPATPEFIRERMNVVLENTMKELLSLHALAVESKHLHTAEFILRCANNVRSETTYSYFVSQDNRVRENA